MPCEAAKAAAAATMGMGMNKFAAQAPVLIVISEMPYVKSAALGAKVKNNDYRSIDIGHNYCTGKMDEPVIMERIDRLNHMHMHDARDGKKDHQALGTGELDIPYFIHLADSRDCTVVLETKTEEGLRQSVKWLKENGKL